MKKLLFSLALIPLICSGEETNKLLSAQETTNAIIALAGTANPNPSFNSITVTSSISMLSTAGSRLYLVGDSGSTNVTFDGTNLTGNIISSNTNVVYVTNVYYTTNITVVTNASGIFNWSINLTNIQTTNGTPLPVWTNTVLANNSFSTKYWGIGSGTNKFFFEKFGSFYRDSGVLLRYASNNIIEHKTTSYLDAYATTNGTTDVVWYVKGDSNSPMGWNFYAMNDVRTNAESSTNILSEVDPTTIAGIKLYYNATNLNAIADGTDVGNFYDLGGGNFHLVGAGSDAPKKQTVDGVTTVQFNGTADYLYSSASMSITNLAAPGSATFVFRIKPGTNWQAGLLRFGASNNYTNCISMWSTYNGDFYFDWKDSTDGRIQVTKPAGWENNWHTLAYVRGANYQLIRVDGSILYSNVVAGSAIYAPQATAFYLGGISSGANKWAGDFRALATFTNILTAEQIDGIGLFFANQP